MSKPLLLALSVLLLSASAAALADDASSSSAMSSMDMSSMASSSALADTTAVTADATAGATVFKQCGACHAVGPGATNRVGPELNGLIGRPAGTAPEYRYSAAMKNSGLTWDAATFAKYINDPRGTVPGNKMSFGGIHDPKQIADLTAYLATFNADGSTKQ